MRWFSDVVSPSSKSLDLNKCPFIIAADLHQRFQSQILWSLASDESSTDEYSFRMVEADHPQWCQPMKWKSMVLVMLSAPSTVQRYCPTFTCGSRDTLWRSRGSADLAWSRRVVRKCLYHSVSAVLIVGGRLQYPPWFLPTAPPPQTYIRHDPVKLEGLVGVDEPTPKTSRL